MTPDAAKWNPNFQNFSGEKPPDPLMGTRVDAFGIRNIAPALILGSCRYDPVIFCYLVYFRYVAIVYPMQAHVLCTGRRIRIAITSIWLFSCMSALPVLIFNTVAPPQPGVPAFCIIRFPGDHVRYLIPWKYSESAIYYFIPAVIQLVLYAIICKRLFATSHQLHRRMIVTDRHGKRKKRHTETMRCRKSVVKMLITSVVIYFVSYSPHQIILVYNTVAPRPFLQKWLLHVFVTMMTFVNSAANPILYAVFSRSFRQRVGRLLLRSSGDGPAIRHRSTPTNGTDSPNRIQLKSLRVSHASDTTGHQTNNVYLHILDRNSHGT